MNPKLLATKLMDASEDARDAGKQTLSNAFWMVANVVAKGHYDITRTLRAVNENAQIAASDRVEVMKWLRARI